MARGTSKKPAKVAKKTAAKEPKAGDSPSQLIDARIKALGDGGARRWLGSAVS
jgi:hypothetical protein